MLAPALLISLIAAWPVAVQPETDDAAAPGAAQSLWFDAASGRSRLNYPPHRSADIRHIRLDLTIADMNTPRFDGVATISLEPLGRPLSTLRLNAAEMHVSSVECVGFRVSFNHDLPNEELAIRFDPPVALGQRVDVRVAYSVVEPTEGVIWTVESPAYPGRAAQFHTQGESESSRYWFPCADFPNERQSTEIVVTVPSGYTAISNGRLESHERAGATERFHWRQDREHVAYLVSLVVGKFDSVDVAPAGSRVPMPVFVPPGQAAYIPATFGRTPRMVALFERLFDEPFPWDKYGQVLVWNFAWGGMENTSATTLIDTTLLDRTALLDGDEDSLISHELAHQWFGDLITCRSWEHIWLNEGLATYCEKLWEQYRNSGGSTLTPDNDAYLWGILEDMEGIASQDRGEDPFDPPMQCKCYGHPVEVFDRAANPYAKGSAVLHMLREHLGDEAFFRGMATYIDRQRDSNAETYALRRALEDVAGVSLQRFFEQWCRRPGVPRLRIRHEWKSDSQTLAITVEQTQRIDGDSPAYAFTLPVWVRTPAGTRWLDIAVDKTSTEFETVLDGEPLAVVFDPRLAVLADVHIERPEPRGAELWLAQLHDGPTLAARVQAAAALAQTVAPKRPDSPPHPQIVAALDALTSIVENPALHHGLRQRAAQALGRMANPTVDSDDEKADNAAALPLTFPDRNAGAALAVLAHRSIEDARVRKAVIEQLARAAAPGGTTDDATRARVLAQLSERFHRDPSVAVRAAAVRGVGTMRAADGAELIQKGLATDSFSDRIRREALRAWADFDTAEALGGAIRLSLPGNEQLTREAAAEAIAKLAKHDEQSAIAALSSMMNETSQRMRYGAAGALGKIHTPAARAALEARRREVTSREFRHHLDEALAEFK